MRAGHWLRGGPEGRGPAFLPALHSLTLLFVNLAPSSLMLRASMGLSEPRDVAVRFPLFWAPLAGADLPALSLLEVLPFGLVRVLRLRLPGPPPLSPQPAARAAPTTSSPRSGLTPLPVSSSLVFHPFTPLGKGPERKFPPLPKKSPLPADISRWGRCEEAWRPFVRVQCPAVSPRPATPDPPVSMS